MARIAAELALPFAVLRVIADPAERALPPAALAGMRTDGGMDVGAVLASLAKSPAPIAGSHSRCRRGRPCARSTTPLRRSSGVASWLPRSQLVSAAHALRTRIAPAVDDRARCPVPSVRSVLMPASASFASFHGLRHRIHDGRGFVAAMDHAIGAFFVIASAIFIPRRVLHQFLEGLGVTFTEQVTRALPAEHSAGRVPPRSAVIGLIAGEEIEEQAPIGTGANFACPCDGRCLEKAALFSCD